MCYYATVPPSTVIETTTTNRVIEFYDLPSKRAVTSRISSRCRCSLQYENYRYLDYCLSCDSRSKLKRQLKLNVRVRWLVSLSSTDLNVCFMESNFKSISFGSTYDTNDCKVNFLQCLSKIVVIFIVKYLSISNNSPLHFTPTLPVPQT